MCRSVVSCRRFRFKSMTQVSTGNERDRSSQSVYGSANTLAKLQVVLIAQETVAQRNHLAFPAIAIQKVKWHRAAMIQRVAIQRQYLIFLFACCFSDFRQQFFVQRKLEGGVGSAKVCKVAVKNR